MLYIDPLNSVFDYATYFTMHYIFDAWDKPALFQTGWFVESLLSQTLIVHVIRTGKIPFFQSKTSLPLMVTTVSICVVGMWVAAVFDVRCGAGIHAASAWLLAGARRHAGGLTQRDAVDEDLAHQALRAKTDWRGRPAPPGGDCAVSGGGVRAPVLGRTTQRSLQGSPDTLARASTCGH